MKRGQIFVRAKKKDGSWGSVDVLDLDEQSFRAFILEMLIRQSIVCSIKDEFVEGDDIQYHERKK